MLLEWTQFCPVTFLARLPVCGTFEKRGRNASWRSCRRTGLKLATVAQRPCMLSQTQRRMFGIAGRGSDVA
jgi:hypothetical protein